VKSSARLAAVFALLFLAAHLAVMPSSLEDLDSINFALGVRHFDVTEHQPHPPGYPLFIAAAKSVHALGLSEVRALSLLNIAAGALSILALLALFTAWHDDRKVPPLLTTLVVVTAPLFWLTASRPLSDVAGLAPSIAIQALTIRARSPRQFILAAFLAALAAGIRSQVVWLTLPVLAVAVWQIEGARIRTAAAGAVAYAVGALLWIVPLLWLSGGPAAYWKAFSFQGNADLSGVAMLATTPTVRQAIRAFQYTFVAPWGYWQLAAAVLALAVLGAIHLAWRAPRTLLWVVAAYGPYAIFDVLFQETVTTRYALPVVVPIGYLAARGASWLPAAPAIGVALTIVGFSMVIDDRALYGYAGEDAPSFRMVGDMAQMREQAGAAFKPPVLAFHRREMFDLRRTLQWAGDRVPPVSATLPSTNKHEWLELVKYWNDGGRDTIWFVADPLRSDLALIRRASRPVLYRWSFEPTILLGGSRPSVMDWHVIDPPDWYLGEGWALTPETGGIAREDGKGPGVAPIEGWVRRSPQAMHLFVGGRNLTSENRSATLTVTFDGRVVDTAALAPGFFLRSITVPPSSPGAYALVTVAADSKDVAIEQFDAQPGGRVSFAYADGWNELEFNPATGELWRWSTDRSTLRVRAEGHALALTLRGELEAASSSRITVRAGDRVVATLDVGKTFEQTVLIPADAVTAAESVLTIESSAWYVPAEASRRSADRRRLGLKLFECRVSAAS
jgi:hypothetical protein